MTKMALLIYRLAFFLYIKKIPLIPLLINKILLRMLFSCQIGLGAKIGKGVILGYGGLAIVIHHNAIIGNNVNIGTGVTIGGTTKKGGFQLSAIIALSQLVRKL